ncbi:Uncharacterised protein [Pseudomonas aeruginosa]|nr:Uncharacterised protein [Pseudomonas aeruginosa]
MGWYFSPQSRSELIAELIAPQQTERVSAKVIAHALRGNVLWSVVELTAKVEGVHRDLAPGQSLRYIRCDLLERSGNQWGYKPLEESMHPYYYSCPLSYLDLAPEQSAECVQAFAPTTPGGAHPRLSRHPPRRRWPEPGGTDMDPILATLPPSLLALVEGSLSNGRSVLRRGNAGVLHRQRPHRGPGTAGTDLPRPVPQQHLPGRLHADHFGGRAASLQPAHRQFEPD